MNLKSYLKSKNLSLYKVAKESGISYSTLHDICSGKIPLGNLRVSLLSNLAHSLNLTMDDLYQMETSRKTEKLPYEFYIYFWDTIPEELNLDENQDFIISRLFDKGNKIEIKWLTSIYTEEEIKETAKRSRNFNPIVANYLRNKYHLKKEEMRYYQMGHKAQWR